MNDQPVFPTVINRERTAAIQIESTGGMAEFGIKLEVKSPLTDKVSIETGFFSYSELLKIKDAIDAAIAGVGA